MKRNPITQLQKLMDGAAYERDAAGYYGLFPEWKAAKTRLRNAQKGKTKARKAIKAKRKQKHR